MTKTEERAYQVPEQSVLSTRGVLGLSDFVVVDSILRYLS